MDLVTLGNLKQELPQYVAAIEDISPTYSPLEFWRKMSKYADLAVSCKQNGFATTLVTVQVCSRGFQHQPRQDNLYKLVKAPLNHKTDFERQLMRRAIEGSYSIWCSRNTAS